MTTEAARKYMESRILSADPVELVQIMLEGALQWVNKAQRHSRAGELLRRDAAIGRAFEFVSELRLSLNDRDGGAIGESLGELYSFMQRRLLAARQSDSDTSLAEVRRILSALLDGWQGVKSPRESGPITVGDWH